MPSWRDSSRPIIAAILAKNLDPEQQKEALFAAYPWGMRKYHPYKIWLDEIQVQTGRRAEKTRTTREREADALGQERLFGEVSG